MTTIDGQLDLLAVLEEQEAQERFDRGALSGFTTSDEFDPWELHEAFEAWVTVHGRLGSFQKSHMWHIWNIDAGWSGAHSPVQVSCDLRTPPPPLSGIPYQGPGDLMTRLYCTDCKWWTPISDCSSRSARAYLDHCWPGWRDLPPIPQKGEYRRPPKENALPADYPAEWKVPGAPTINYSPACFTPPTSSRPSFVPGYSVFGGMGIGIHPTIDYPELTAVPPP